MSNPYFSMLSTAWKYARLERPRFILIYVLFILATIVVALNPLFYGWFVNDIQQKGADVLGSVWIYVTGFLGLRLVEWMFHGPARIMERQLAFKLSKNLMEDYYDKVLRLPLDWHQDNHSGSTISKLRKSYEAMRDFFQHGFVYLYSFGKFFFSFAAMLYFSPLFGGIGIVIGFFTVLIIMQFDKPYIKTLREVNQQEHEVSSTLFDSLSNIRTVITLKLEKRIHQGLLGKIANVFPPFRRNVKINEWKWFTAQMMVGLIYCVSVFGYIYQHHVPGEIFQIGGLIVLIGYVNQFTSVFNDIASQYTQIVRFHTEVQNTREIESAFASLERVRSGTGLPERWKNITLKGLYFSRSDDKQSFNNGLSDINLEMKRGARIAIIGESGSGKSTLLTILRGLHKPTAAGQITVNGELDIDLQHLSEAMTLFPQEPEIFENTIRYNITLGLPFSDEEVMGVCALARFTEVVNSLPAGLSTHIKEKGVNLSGGQKQRLALARGILAAAQSDIILMDEPTSSVDPRTESLIYSNLLSCFPGKTIVSSLHRMHLLPQFDYIYILRNGTVIDEGTFADLFRYSLVFKEMWQHQQASLPEDEGESRLNVAL